MLEVGIQRLSWVLPKAEQNRGEQEKVEKVAQLICQLGSPYPSRQASPGLAEARGAQNVNETVSTEL